jgi:hypothetical protein
MERLNILDSTSTDKIRLEDDLRKLAIALD